MRNWFLLIVLISTTIVSAAQTPPVTPFGANEWKPTMKRTPSTGIRMGAFRVRFEETTLYDVRQAASLGVLGHTGDAGESVYWLCYTVEGNTQAERLWLISDGEMGGPQHNVTGVSATRLPRGIATAGCPALPENLKPLSLDNDLWLGASREAATSRLGRFSLQNDAWGSYDFEGKVAGDCAGSGYDFSASLLLHFEHGRAEQLHFRQVTSC